MDYEAALTLFDQLFPENKEKFIAFLRLIETDPAAAKKLLEDIAG